MCLNVYTLFGVDNFIIIIIIIYFFEDMHANYDGNTSAN